MGMFDRVTVEKDNIFGIADAEYQTKCLNCELDTYTIHKDGTITTTGTSSVINGVIEIYGDDKSGKWYEYDIYVKDSKVVRVVEQGNAPRFG